MSNKTTSHIFALNNLCLLYNIQIHKVSVATQIQKPCLAQQLNSSDLLLHFVQTAADLAMAWHCHNVIQCFMAGAQMNRI